MAGKDDLHQHTAQPGWQDRKTETEDMYVKPAKEAMEKEFKKA